MQINTSTLLNMLGSNVDNNIKEKIQQQSSAGKSDISALVKDKNIQTLLSDTFKSLSSGAKSANTVFETLQNSKQTFDVKNLTNDIKSVITTLESNPKTQKEASILKDFLVNVKDLDNNSLKTNLNNTGIQLESKLNALSNAIKDPVVAKQVQIQKAIESLVSNIKIASQNNPTQTVINNLKSDITNLSNIVQKSDIKSEIKTAISNLLSNIKLANFEAPIKTPQQATVNAQVLTDLKTIEKQLFSKENPQISNLQNGIKDLKINTNSLINNNSLQFQTSIKNISNLLTKPDLPLEIKTAVSNLLANIKGSNIEAKIETFSSKPVVSNIVTELKNIEKALVSKEPNVLQTMQKSISNIENSIKQLNSFNPLELQQNIKTNITNISNTLTKADLPLEIKTAINNLLTNIKTTNLEPKMLNQDQVKNISQNISKLESINQNISKLINIDTTAKTDNQNIKLQSNTNLANNNQSIKIENNPSQINNNLKAETQVKQILVDNIKSLVTNLKTLLNNNPSQTLLANIKENISNIGNQVIKMDLPLEIKKDINNIFTNFKAMDLDQAIVSKDKMQINIPKLTAVVEQLKTLDNNLAKISNPIVHTSNLLEELSNNLKTVMEKGVDQNIINNMKTVMTNISHVVSKGDIPVEVKTAVNNLLSNINNMGVDNKLNMPQPALKQVIGNITNLQTQLNSINQTNISNLNPATDIKAVLLQLNEAIDKNDANIPRDLKPTVEKLLTQVEYFQALSYTSASNISFLPFEWDDVKDGDIKISKKKDDEFTCQINLSLKDKGDIKVLLQLDKKKNIQINMAIEKDEFKSAIQEKLQDLRKGINNIDLNLQALNIFDMIDHTKKQSNPYENKEQLNFGLDVKI